MFGVKVMVPWASMFTTPFGVLICCAVPGVKGTPLIAVMVNGLPSGCVGIDYRFRVTAVLNKMMYV